MMPKEDLKLMLRNFLEDLPVEKIHHILVTKQIENY